MARSANQTHGWLARVIGQTCDGPALELSDAYPVAAWSAIVSFEQDTAT